MDQANPSSQTQVMERPLTLGEERREPLRLGVVISGSGTNLQAIIDEIDEGRLPARVAVVVSNKGDAYGLERARNHGIPAFHVDPKAFEDFSAYNEALRDKLKEHGVELVVLAGYMRLLGVEVLRAFPNRVMNIHPTLLPSFPGAHGVRALISPAWTSMVARLRTYSSITRTVPARST